MKAAIGAKKFFPIIVRNEKRMLQEAVEWDFGPAPDEDDEEIGVLGLGGFGEGEPDEAG